ncbi:hypothetical protein ACLB1M_31555 [Escherichia coli]
MTTKDCYAATRFDLAIKAFEHTAAYDSMIANYFGSMVPAYHGESKEAAGRFPRCSTVTSLRRGYALRREQPPAGCLLYRRECE